MLLDIFLADAIARLAAEDHYLADHVAAVEVEAWVRFGKACFASHEYRLTHRYVLAESVEDEVERAAHHSLDLKYLVARVDEVVDGVDDRQACTYVGLEKILHATLAGCALQETVVVVVAAGSNLVGANHADVVVEERVIDLGHFSRSCAIDKDSIEHILLDDLVAQEFWRRLLGRCLEQ